MGRCLFVSFVAVHLGPLYASTHQMRTAKGKNQTSFFPMGALVRRMTLPAKADMATSVAASPTKMPTQRPTCRSELRRQIFKICPTYRPHANPSRRTFARRRQRSRRASGPSCYQRQNRNQSPLLCRWNSTQRAHVFNCQVGDEESS